MDRLHRADDRGRAWTRVADSRCLVWVVLLPWIGCNAPGIDPWRDDSISPAAFGTASSAVVLEAGQAPAMRVRDVPPTEALRARDEVPHWPLWWEDPFEDQGDGNTQFAWTWQDYLTMPYGFARFALNTVAFPVSAVVTPPGTPMVSDGRVGNTHDARRGHSPSPVAGAEDFMDDPSEQPVIDPAPVPEPSPAGQAEQTPPV